MKHGTRIASGALALLLVLSACVTSGVTAHAATPSQTALMQQWVEEGLLTGDPDGSLRPDDTVTRAEFVHLMNNLGFTGTVTANMVNYTDVETNAWYYQDIMSATAAGYVSGRANGSFGPRDTITRQEGIAMVVRALNVSPDYTTGAQENCSSWFIGEVGAAIGLGLYGTGTDFTADLSRAETVALLEAVRGKQSTGSTATGSSGLPGVSGSGLGIAEDVTTGKTGSDETITKKSDKISGTVADVTISSKLGSNAYTLDGVTITGDLIIESTGTITLDDVTVKGSIIIEGSNAKVVLKKNASVGDVVFHDAGTISGSSFKGSLDTVTVDTDSKTDAVYLSVPASKVVLESRCYLHVQADVDELTVKSGAKNATIEIAYGAEADEVELNAAVELYGRGDINKLYINASNCTISRALDIGKTTKASGVKGTSYSYDDYYGYSWIDDDGWCYKHNCYYWQSGCTCDVYDWYYDGYYNGAVSLTVGSTKTLTAYTSSKNIYWTTGNKNIATVNNGVVTAVGSGTTYIYAENYYGDVLEYWKVKVSEPASYKVTYTASTGIASASLPTGSIAAGTKLSAVGSVTLTAGTGYDIATLEPKLTMGSTTLVEGTDYQVSNGVITFQGSKTVTGNIVVSATIEKTQVPVTVTNTANATVTATGGTKTDSGYTVAYGDTLTLTVKAADGAALNITPSAYTDTVKNDTHTYTITLSNVTAAQTITISPATSSDNSDSTSESADDPTEFPDIDAVSSTESTER